MLQILLESYDKVTIIVCEMLCDKTSNDHSAALKVNEDCVIFCQ